MLIEQVGVAILLFSFEYANDGSHLHTNCDHEQASENKEKRGNM